MPGPSHPIPAMLRCNKHAGGWFRQVQSIDKRLMRRPEKTASGPVFRRMKTMNSTHPINDTQSINAQFAAMNATAEVRARAMQAAFIGEVVSAAICRIGKAVSGLVHSWREWSERRQSLAYLEQMDERLLADIGLSRTTLEDVLYRPAPIAGCWRGPAGRDGDRGNDDGRHRRQPGSRPDSRCAAQRSLTETSRIQSRGAPPRVFQSFENPRRPVRRGFSSL